MIFDSPPKLLNESWKKVMHPNAVEYKKWIQALWKNYQSFAPDDFQHHIENDTNKFESSIWEMLLANALIKAGFTLKKVESDNPDICISHNGLNIWIECTIPEKGDQSKADSIPEKQLDGKVREIPMDKNTLRVTNVLNIKKKQYASWLKKGICKINEPFILALHGLNLDLDIYNDRLPDIFRALYGIGDMYMSFDPKSDYKEAGYLPKPAIEKCNKSLVETTFFCNENNKEITGVIYSKDWWSRFSNGSINNAPRYCYVKNRFAAIEASLSFKGFAQEYFYQQDYISMNPINGGR